MRNKIITSFFCLLLAVSALIGLLMPDRYYSEREKRTLTQKPKFTVADFISGKFSGELEKYLTDQVPLRDGWVTMKTYMELAVGKRESSGVYLCKDQYLMDKFTAYSKKQLTANVEALAELQSKLAAEGIAMNTLLVPMAAQVLTDKLPAYAPVADYAAILQVLTDADVDTTDVLSALAAHIAALQEAGGKLSRNMIDDGYEAFSQVVTLCIELIRQFYDVPRQFRLLGRDGGAFVAYGNGGLRPRALLTGGYRVPEFDLEVMAQDETPYQTMEYNQLALQLFQMGFFRSDMAEQALRCLELMQFRSKDALAEVIRQGQKETDQKAWLTEALRRAVTLLDKSQGTHLAEALERELEKRESSGGKAAAPRSSDAVTRQRQATRQAVRPR